MRIEEDEKIYKENPELSKMFRPVLLEEQLEQVKQWKNEGKTKEEVLNLIDRRVLIDSDIETIYADESNIKKLEKDDRQVENNKNEENGVDSNYLVFLKDEELIDYEDQPFSTDNKEDNKLLEDSIRLNGIIEPIVVRPYQSKYQILSGHRRRKCGRNIGLTEFPCYVREKTDDEAKLYLVDTNLVTREKIKPTERAKAYLLRKEALKSKKLKEKVDAEILEDSRENLNIRDTMVKENNMSNGNIQRYLRINYLTEELQEATDLGEFSLTVAEYLSFLTKEEQNIVASNVRNNRKKLNENQAKMLKIYSQNEELTHDKINELINNKKLSEKITISFKKSELEEYFEDLRDKRNIKNELLHGIKLLRN